jgi:hypothetical protein
MRTASTTGHSASFCPPRHVDSSGQEDEAPGVFVASSAARAGVNLTTAQVTEAASTITQGMKAATPSRPRNVCTTLVE